MNYFSSIHLSPTDVVYDAGCGDGRILIEVVKRFGCRGIGVEIDEVKVGEAKRKVAEAHLSQRILIMQGDIMSFNPENYGVTVMVAFLYPETLAKLSPTSYSAKTVISPFHKIPQLAMTQYGDLWVYQNWSLFKFEE